MRGRLGLIMMAGLALSACETTVNTHGFIPDEAALAKLKPGVQNRGQVAEILGSPSSVSNFDDSNWYYISRRTSSLAFFRPTVLEQEVVVVAFDGGGRVAEVQHLTLADGLPITPTSRETPTPGRELGILQQLIGNLGRFNPSSSTTGRSTTGPGN